jgi:GDP/UDP-N,N'-diacetylbacillosamine 2-epimerase (hydrolysing)
MRRQICVITGSRAEYGLLRQIISKLYGSNLFSFGILVTGSHLSQKFGFSVSEIEGDGYRDYKTATIDMDEDDPLSMAKSLGQGVTVLAERLSEMSPDLVLVLGDRFEILAATIAAYTLRIPVAHFHGGEVTGGALDEGYRHAITKMASLHFVAAEEYRQRVIQMGEDPSSVHTIGAPGLEAIHTARFLSLNELSEKLNIQLESQKYLVLAFHPETASQNLGIDEFKTTLNAMDELRQKFKILISKSNADAGGRAIGSLIDEYTKSRSDSVRSFMSLGHLGFTSLVKHSAALVGNSSAGIIEAPALGVPTVNIGSRQKGRLLASSVISVGGKTKEILQAINVSTMPDQNRFRYLPYGTGNNVSERVLEILTTLQGNLSPVKSFYDLRAVGDV